MKDCERFEALISEMLDGELSPGEEAEVRAHMESCPECAAMYLAETLDSVSREFEWVDDVMGA